MAWQTPKTNWGQSGQTVPIADDFNRIEGNIQHLQDTKAAGAELDAHKAEIATEDKSGHIEVLEILPGEILVASADKDFVFSQQSDYIKAKEFKAIRDCAIRVKFALQGFKGYGRIYINGVPKGKERYVASAGDEYEKTFVEDFLNIKKDDLIQLYVKGGDALDSAKTRNFRIYCYYNVSSIATVQQD